MIEQQIYALLTELCSGPSPAPSLLLDEKGKEATEHSAANQAMDSSDCCLHCPVFPGCSHLWNSRRRVLICFENTVKQLRS